MKKLAPLTLLIVVFGCTPSGDNVLLGSWKACNRWNGEYIEYRYFDSYVFYASESYWSPTTFPIELDKDTFRVWSLDRLQSFKIDPVSKDSLLLRNNEDTIFLIRLIEEIPSIDSSNLESWLTTYELDFRRRSIEWTSCKKIPIKEPLDLGEVDDDFEDLIMPDLTNLDSTYVQ